MHDEHQRLPSKLRLGLLIVVVANGLLHPLREALLHGTLQAALEEPWREHVGVPVEVECQLQAGQGAREEGGREHVQQCKFPPLLACPDQHAGPVVLEQDTELGAEEVLRVRVGLK
jgi:hypothetical protein